MVTAEIREVGLEAFLADPALEGLLEAHYDELAQLKHLQKLRPMLEAYRNIAAEGRLLILGVYGPELIGYSVCFLTQMMHYADCLVAQNDVLFIDWRFRGYTLGNQLLAATAQHAKARGASAVLWHAKPGTPLQEIALARRWKHLDSIYAEEV